MNQQQALTFVRKHGIVLMSARGPVPSLAAAIAGEPIRGSWWGHPKSHAMFNVFEAIGDSGEILVCRLVSGKVSYVHRRLWPALVRLRRRLPKVGLAAIREEHTERGHHRTVVTPFPRWVPSAVLARAERLSEAEAMRQIDAEGLQAALGLKAAASRPTGRKEAASRSSGSRRSMRARRA